MDQADPGTDLLGADAYTEGPGFAAPKWHFASALAGGQGGRGWGTWGDSCGSCCSSAGARSGGGLGPAKAGMGARGAGACGPAGSSGPWGPESVSSWSPVGDGCSSCACNAESHWCQAWARALYTRVCMHSGHHVLLLDSGAKVLLHTCGGGWGRWCNLGVKRIAGLSGMVMCLEGTRGCTMTTHLATVGAFPRLSGCGVVVLRSSRWSRGPTC